MNYVSREALGNAIRSFRLELGYTQEDVARALCCQRSSYSYRELGKTSFDLNDLWQLAALFGFPPEVFFHPELFQDSVSSIRARRKSTPGITTVGNLKPPERALICLLREYEALSADSNLTERLQEELNKRIEQRQKSDSRPPQKS